MTKVFLSHNPFTIKTEIIINDEPVVSTSKLYRYRNTPMQDWVGNFLGELVDHCNDDEIEITFKGLQYNFDDLENELEIFLKNNRDYDIQLEHKSSRSQIARWGELDALKDELQSQAVIDELKSEEFLSVINDISDEFLEVHIVSGNDTLKQKFIGQLIDCDMRSESREMGNQYIHNYQRESFIKVECTKLFEVYEGDISFINSKYNKVVVTDLPNTEIQSNTYYRYIKKAIQAESKPIIVYILDKNEMNNNAEYLSLIAEQYALKGKQDKKRFIFISENPIQTKKMLNSDYTIRNATVYATDDVIKVRRAIVEYMNEYCMIKKILNQSATMIDKMNLIYEQFCERANQNKKDEMIDELEYKALAMLSEIDYTYSCEYSMQDQEKSISRLIKEVNDRFSERCFVKSRGLHTRASAIESKKNMENFISKDLSGLLEKYIKDIQKEIDAKIKITCNINKNLSEVLKKLECLNSIKCFSEIERFNLSPTQFNMEEIEAIKISYRTYGMLGGIIKAYMDSIPSYVSLNSSFPDDSTLHEYSFYEGLINITTGKLSGDYYLEQNSIDECKKVFREGVNKVIPIVENYIKDYIEEFNEMGQAYQDKIEEFMKVSREEIRKKVEGLRKNAQISKQEQEALNYILELINKAKALIEL